jgi:hypothetical protein
MDALETRGHLLSEIILFFFDIDQTTIITATSPPEKTSPPSQILSIFRGFAM